MARTGSGGIIKYQFGAAQKKSKYYERHRTEWRRSITRDKAKIEMNREAMSFEGTREVTAVVLPPYVWRPPER